MFVPLASPASEYVYELRPVTVRIALIAVRSSLMCTALIGTTGCGGVGFVKVSVNVNGVAMSTFEKPDSFPPAFSARTLYRYAVPAVTVLSEQFVAVG